MEDCRAVKEPTVFENALLGRKKPNDWRTLCLRDFLPQLEAAVVWGATGTRLGRRKLAYAVAQWRLFWWVWHETDLKVHLGELADFLELMESPLEDVYDAFVRHQLEILMEMIYHLGFQEKEFSSEFPERRIGNKAGFVTIVGLMVERFIKEASAGIWPRGADTTYFTKESGYRGPAKNSNDELPNWNVITEVQSASKMGKSGSYGPAAAVTKPLGALTAAVDPKTAVPAGAKPTGLCVFYLGSLVGARTNDGSKVMRCQKQGGCPSQHPPLASVKLSEAKAALSKATLSSSAKAKAATVFEKCIKWKAE